MLIFNYSFSPFDKSSEARGSDNIVRNLPQCNFFLLKMSFEDQMFHYFCLFGWLLLRWVNKYFFRVFLQVSWSLVALLLYLLPTQYYFCIVFQLLSWWKGQKREASHHSWRTVQQCTTGMGDMRTAVWAVKPGEWRCRKRTRFGYQKCHCDS